MMKSYTELDLLRFIYKDVDICEYFEIDHALQEDELLSDEFQSLKKAVNSLPTETHDPSATSLQNILGYAAA